MKPGDVVFIKATVDEVQPDGMVMATLHLVRQMVRVPSDAIEVPASVAVSPEPSPPTSIAEPALVTDHEPEDVA